MPIQRVYSFVPSEDLLTKRVLNLLKNDCYAVDTLQVEKCFHIETTLPLKCGSRDEVILRWLIKPPQTVDNLQYKSVLDLKAAGKKILIEIGPRFNFSTAFSTNCVNICMNLGLQAEVQRLEMSIRYLIGYCAGVEDFIDENHLVDILGDLMTECRYTAENIPVESFNERLSVVKSLTSWHFVPLLCKGRKALEAVNVELGLAFSEWDMNYYMNLFCNVLKRDPTTVELFDCAQSNSEHSRHWFFRGKLFIDGIEQPLSLIRMIMDTQTYSNSNNTIMFSDNSSAIRGFTCQAMRSECADGPGMISMYQLESDLIFTAETHNMPTAVAPFSGATTGTGGRLRDVQAVGRGAWPIAGTVGYSVGCLNIPGYSQKYEDNSWQYPKSFSKPLNVLIEASNGASDYGNKFGEPVIAGFVHSYGIRNANGERDEYVKPIMFSGGLGTMPAKMRTKMDPKRGMLLVKIGGPVYRIGVGGGAASSVEVQGSGDSDLDFNAVQRGDAEMENKLNRVVRACIEMGDKNPILAIHDQGAGGNGNVLKELVEPGFAGAVIFSKEFQLGDPTINALELWGAEYQENNALLCNAEDRHLLERICERERCPISFVGVVTGNGRVTLIEDNANFEQILTQADNYTNSSQTVPFNLELKHVLGDMPKREYHLNRLAPKLEPLRLNCNIRYDECVKRVLSLLAVGSKRFLTNKVDRCVTGLIAQQQCVGPLHTPLADYGLIAISHFGCEGIATSIGTQPIKGLLNAASMARMCVAEALSNLVFVTISELGDVKCSANWMWAAKLCGEGAKLFDACQEMCTIMKELGIAVDGGKDSLSMAAKVGNDPVKSPGTLVVSAYAPCADIMAKITPDLKGPASGIDTVLLWINIEGKFRLGASALAQSYGQQGMECPTVLQTEVLKNAFNITQKLLVQRKLLAGHDVSDGGLLVCLLEMAFGGLSGLEIDLTFVLKELQSKHIDAAATAIKKPELAVLFAEECGWVLEVESAQLATVQDMFTKSCVPNYIVGKTGTFGLQSRIIFACNNSNILDSSVSKLFKQWEATSFELEKLQTNKECALEEFSTLDYRTGPKYKFDVKITKELTFKRLISTIRVAVLREEGVNSDREMISTLMRSNFEVHDVTMSDLLAGKTTLQNYRGLVFPGGFTYADTLFSAKGWASNIMFSELLVPQFSAFKNRKDAFSLGICNGCQLMSLIGWVGCFVTADEMGESVIEVPNVALLSNKSGRFECRWSTVRVARSKSIMLRTLQDSVLGCWVAHGEGRFSFRNSTVLNNIKAQNCVTLHYVDDNGKATEAYPMNPNGSVEGIAGICSEDGRHLALMPHPERCSSMFQWPYIPHNFNVTTIASPWQLMFNDAFKWCQSV